MNLLEANAYLGVPDILVSLLVLLIGVAGGGLVISLLAGMLKLPIMPPLVIFIVYLLLGSINYFGIATIFVAPDASSYDAQAMDIAGDLGLRVPIGFEYPLYSGKEGFSVILGGLYRILGRAPMAGVVFNSLISALTVLVIFATSRLAFGSMAKLFVLASFLFVPSYLTYGSDLLREALCWLGVSLILYFVVALLKGQNRAVGLLGFLVGFALLYWVRTTLGLLSIAAVFAAVSSAILWRRFGGNGLAIVLGIGIVGISTLGEFVLNALGFDSSRIMLIRRVNMQDASSGYQALLGQLEGHGVLGAVVATLPNTLLGPFPWELRPEAIWLWVLLNAVFWWAALIGVIRIIWVNRLNELTVSLLVFAAILLLGLSITLTNYGTIYRLKTIPLIVLMVILAQPMVREKKSTKFAFSQVIRTAPQVEVERP